MELVCSAVIVIASLYSDSRYTSPPAFESISGRLGSAAGTDATRVGGGAPNPLLGLPFRLCA